MTGCQFEYRHGLIYAAQHGVFFLKHLHGDIRVKIVAFEGDLLAPEINVAAVAAAELLNR